MESSHLRVFTPAGRSNAVLPCRVSCLVRLMLFAYDASESYPLRILSLLLDGSFLTSRNGVLSPPSFHSRRSFKRGSTLSGILPRTAHAVRLRCKRVLSTQNIKSIVRWVFFNVSEWSPLTSEFSLPQVVQTRFYPVGYPASYGSCCSPTMQASPNHSEY